MLVFIEESVMFKIIGIGVGFFVVGVLVVIVVYCVVIFFFNDVVE